MSKQPAPTSTTVNSSCEKAESKDDGHTVIDVDRGSSTGAPPATRPAENDKSQVKNESPPSLKNFLRIISYATALDKLLMTVAMICGAAAGVAMPLMNIFFGKLVNNFNSYFTPGSGTTEDEFTTVTSKQSLYILCLFIGRAVLGYFSIFTYRMTGIRISANIRRAYMTALFKQSISAVDKLPPGYATDSLGRSANTIQFGVSDKLSLMVQSCTLTVAAYVIAFTHSWALTLAMSSSIVLILVFYSFFMIFWVKFEASINHSNAKAASVAGESLKSIRTIKSLCAENAMAEKYNGWITQSKETGIRMTPLSAVSLSPVFFALYASMALALWLGIKLYLQGTVSSIGDIVVAFSSVLLVVGSMGSLIGPLQGISQAAAASSSLFKIIDAPIRLTTGLKNPEAEANSDIRFKCVRFTYPGRPTNEVLKGLELSVPAGKITALVGPSGCGKSTIVGLLERWYQLSDINERLPERKGKEDMSQAEKLEEKLRKKQEDKEAKLRAKKSKKGKAAPTSDPSDEKEDPSHLSRPIIQNSGSIFVGSHDIESLDLKWWRSQIGLVQQEPFLFDETIYENIAMGLIGSMWENEADDVKRNLVREACKESFADEFIQRLPEGYETRVGESGMKLSGGQRQRLAIARSIVKQPTILILDEATSSIDVRAERIVQAALDRASKNRTTITIAHRLSTIRKADHIVVMKEGAAVEDGTHDELIRKPDGVYANLVNAQRLEVGVEEEEDRAPDEVAKIEDSIVIDELLEKVKSEAEEQANVKPDKRKQPLRHLLTSVGLLRAQNDATAEKEEQRGFFKSVGLILYEQRRKHRLVYLLILLAAACAGAVFALQSFMLGHYMSVFTSIGPQMESSGNFWALMLFILALSCLGSYSVLSACMNVLSVNVTATCSTQYFESVLGKPVPFFDKEEQSSGSLTAQLSNDPKQLQMFVGIGLSLPLLSSLGLIGCTIFAFYYGWKLSLVVFCSALPAILTASYVRVRYEIKFTEYNTEVFMQSSKFAAEAIGAFRTVAALTLEDDFLIRYNGMLQSHIDKAFRTAWLACAVFALSDSIDLLCVALSTWYGGLLMGSREYSPLQYYLIYYALIQGGQAAGQFLALSTTIGNATEAANRMIGTRSDPEVQYGKKEDLQTVSDEKAVQVCQKGGMGLDFNDVAFTYPTRDTPVYRSFNLRIAPGEYMAFVGPSGCGKSTIVSLLSRFYRVSSGSLLADGKDLNDITMADYRRQVALVSQEPTLFEGTIRENLVLGLPNAEAVPDQEIEDACRAAEIHEFISSLPDSYATPLAAGTHASLSGGQKQRLCIARALLRKPRLLLLDEATSSLDSHSEGMVQKAIEQVAGRGDVTVVVVAHRLATVQNAGRVIVLGDGGKVMEEGRHTELIGKRGVYWNMCRMQALDR